MRNLKGLTISAVVMLAMSVSGQTAQTERPSVDERLERPLPGNELEYFNTTSAFRIAMGSVRMPGGAARILGCEGDDFKQLWSPWNKTLRQALDSLVEADPRYSWQVVGGVINLLPADGEPALLKTRISQFSVRDLTSSLDALGQLQTLPEVKKGMEDLHLKPGIALISYWPSPNPKPFSVECKNVTLREALNAIARAQGRDIWDYVEVHCAGKDEVVIRF